MGLAPRSGEAPWRYAMRPRNPPSSLVVRQEEDDDDSDNSLDEDDDSSDEVDEDDILDVFPALPVRPSNGGNVLEDSQTTTTTSPVGQPTSPSTTSGTAPVASTTSRAGATTASNTTRTSTPFVSSTPPAEVNDSEEGGNEEEALTNTTELNAAESDQAEATDAPTLPMGSSELGAAIGILIGSIVALCLILLGFRYFSVWRRSKRKRPPLIPPHSDHDSSHSASSIPRTLSSPHPGTKAAFQPPTLTTTTSGRMSTDWSAFNIEKAKHLESNSDASSIRTGLGVDDRRVSTLEKLEGPVMGARKRDSYWPRKYGINMDFDAEMMSPTMQRHPVSDNRNTTTTASSGILPIGMRV